MINRIKNVEKQNSLRIHNKIRNAGFVKIDTPFTQRLKYLINLMSYIDRFKPLIKTAFNKSWQTPLKFLKDFNWSKIGEDSLYWLGNAAIEGLLANFVTHFLFGIKFSIPLIMAHGILIKHSLNIYWRLRKDGSDPKIS